MGFFHFVDFGIICVGFSFHFGDFGIICLGFLILGIICGGFFFHFLPLQTGEKFSHLPQITPKWKTRGKKKSF